MTRRPWPEVRADLSAAALTGDRRCEALVHETINAVEQHASQLGRACLAAEEELARTRDAAARFVAGETQYLHVNALGVLQGRNGDVDRNAALLEAAVGHAHLVALAVGVETRAGS